MALHDVAKTIKRNSPNPNGHDLPGVARMSYGTNSSNLTTDANASAAAALLNGDLRLVLSGTVSIDATSCTAGVVKQQSIPHGLSYIPLALVFFTPDNSVYIPLPNSDAILAQIGSHLGFTEWAWATVDATNLVINFFPGSTANYNIQTYRYYLFQQTAN